MKKTGLQKHSSVFASLCARVLGVSRACVRRPPSSPPVPRSPALPSGADSRRLYWFLLLSARTEQHNWNCSGRPRSEALLTAESVQGLLHQRETQFSQVLPKARAKQQVEQRRTSVAGHLSSDTKKL